MHKLPKKEFALVLGAAKNGKNGLNPYFKYRMDATIDLWKNEKISQIIVSGDNHTLTYNEADDMKNYLVNHGIPESTIHCDYAGFRTLDSVVRAKKVFGCNSMVIVSQKFHNERALYIAHYYGIDAIAFNAKDVKSVTNLTHIREIFAKLLVIFDLHLFNTKPKFL